MIWYVQTFDWYCTIKLSKIQVIQVFLLTTTSEVLINEVVTQVMLEI